MLDFSLHCCISHDHLSTANPEEKKQRKGKKHNGEWNMKNRKNVSGAIVMYRATVGKV